MNIRRYGGEPENYVVMRMLAEGGLPLDAFVVQERWVVYFNRNSEEERLVAIFPEEGTFWMDHPLVLLEGQGVSEDSLIKAEYRVDPAEPTTLLPVPRVDVLAEVRESWRSLKKPANIYLVVYLSGSMEGEKLAGAKEALHSFIDQLEGERDQVALVAFSSGITDVHPLGPLDREALKTEIRKLQADGGTLLYDAVAHAHRRLQVEGDPERINVIVAMTDGQSQGEFGVRESQMRGCDFPVLCSLSPMAKTPIWRYSSG